MGSGRKMGGNSGSPGFLRAQASRWPAVDVTFGPQRGAEGR
jgi:hypothetical protein